jgi:hypothetical protein
MILEVYALLVVIQVLKKYYFVESLTQHQMVKNLPIT